MAVSNICVRHRNGRSSNKCSVVSKSVSSAAQLMMSCQWFNRRGYQTDEESMANGIAYVVGGHHGTCVTADKKRLLGKAEAKHYLGGQAWDDVLHPQTMFSHSVAKIVTLHFKSRRCFANVMNHCKERYEPHRRPFTSHHLTN